MVFRYSDFHTPMIGFDTENREYVAIDNLLGQTIVADGVYKYMSKTYDCEGMFISFDEGRKYTTVLGQTVVGKLSEEEVFKGINEQGMEMTFFKRKSFKNATRDVLDFC